MCDGRTERECLLRELFGSKDGRANQKLAEAIVPHDTFLFLFNVSAKAFLGPFCARNKAGWQLQPDAWGGGRVSPFPWQVRVYPYARDGALCQLPERDVQDCLTYKPGHGRRFEMSLDSRRATELAQRLLQRGTRSKGPRCVASM